MQQTTRREPTIAGTESPGTPRWKLLPLQLVVLYILGLRLWFGVAATPMGDEAYYWMWGQHLSWSYFDHPPLDGWLQGAVAFLFGWSNLSVRLLSWLSLAGTLWILWLWSERLAPDDREGWFWHSAAIYLTIPVVSIITTPAFHDHLLVFLSIAATWCFHGFTAEWEAGRPAWRRLYAAAALLGLAVLTKYNGVFLGLGFAAWVLVRPRLRPLLLQPRLYLAALLAILIQAPVLYWNLLEGWVSFRFHLVDRPSVDWTVLHWGRLGSFIAIAALVMSPMLFIGLCRLPFLRRATPEMQRATGLSLAIFFASTLGWAAISLYIYVYFHWNIIAYAALAPIAYRLLGGRLLMLAHILFGLFTVTVALLSYTVTPINLPGLSDRTAGSIYGWHELAAHAEAQQTAHPQSFLAATRYTYAAQLGFVLHRSDVAAFNPLPSQNDFWWDAAAHAGRDAIIIADADFPIANAAPHFASVEKLEDVVATRFGKPLWTFEIWLGHDYAGN